MGKAEIGTAKYEAKRLKASGLQKLKFYCQICTKQCRDANGYKNHLTSRSHLGRISNMEKLGETKNVMAQYSQDFQRDFINLLRVNHGTKPINANKFYQEYIRQRDHIHMNITKWKTLTSFVRHLGKNGIVRVTNTAVVNEQGEAGGNKDTDHEEEEEEEGFNLEISLIDGKIFLEKKRDIDTNANDVDSEIAERLLRKQIERGKREEKIRKELKTKNDHFIGRKPEDEAKVIELPTVLTGPIKIGIKKKSLPRTRNVFDDDDDDAE